jgi:hypothetical protein
MLGGSNFGQEEWRNDSETTSAKATPYSRKQEKTEDAGGEHLHQNSTCPNDDCESVRPKSSKLVIEEEGDERTESGTQDAKRTDVGSSICETGCVVLPERLVEAIVILERRQCYTSTETALVVTCNMI